MNAKPPAEAIAELDARAIALLRVRADLQREIRDKQLVVSVIENELRMIVAVKSAHMETEPTLPGEGSNPHDS